MMVRKGFFLKVSIVGLLVSGIFSHNVRAQETQVFTVGVLNLDARGIGNVEADILSDELRHTISQIVRSDDYHNSGQEQYEIVERTEMDRLLSEYEFQFSGCVSDSCVLELGKMLQADRMIIGSVGKIGETYTLTVRMIDVETAKTIRTASQHYRGAIDELLTTVTPIIANDLMYGSNTVLPREITQQTPKSDFQSLSKQGAAIKLKTPSTAFLYSFIPPLIVPVQGGGQYYNGERGKGHIRLLTGLFSFVCVVYGSQVVEPENNLFGTAEPEPRNPGLAATGALLYIVNWISSSIDAYKSAKRINETLQVSSGDRPELGVMFAVQQNSFGERLPQISLNYRF